jgi:hypoxanthine phosphoribosyltransferase
MISAKSIAARIEELAVEIETEFSDTDKLVVVGLLRGSSFLLLIWFGK